jgi:integrase
LDVAGGSNISRSALLRTFMRGIDRSSTSELVHIEIDDVDLNTYQIFINRGNAGQNRYI